MTIKEKVAKIESDYCWKVVKAKRKREREREREEEEVKVESERIWDRAGCVRSQVTSVSVCCPSG